MRSGDYGIAHRTWPMGTRVVVCNERTGLCGFGRVLDRGPYGARGSDGVWFIKSPGGEWSRPGRYLGCADLTPDLAGVIEHDGRDPVILYKIK